MNQQLTQHTVGSTDGRHHSLVQERWQQQEEHLIQHCQEMRHLARRRHQDHLEHHCLLLLLADLANHLLQSWAELAMLTRQPSCSCHLLVETCLLPPRPCSSGWP